MRYWDASAIVPLLVRQTRTEEMACLLAQDAAIVTWWGTPVECLSALMRLIRGGCLNAEGMRAAERRLLELRNAWDEILPGEACRRTAERMLRVHPLRAADALQLAAALIAVDHDPSLMEIVCLDQRLGEAAAKEGFAVERDTANTTLPRTAALGTTSCATTSSSSAKPATTTRTWRRSRRCWKGGE